MTPPSKKFRIQGIAVFVVLTVLIAVFLVLFLDKIIKDTIEDQGSRVMESQIDIASLSTSLLSQSMDIGNLQIANADQLDENLVQAGLIKFDFDGGRALSKKVIIDDMRLEDLRLNQKREAPAKPYKPARKEPEPEGKSEDKSSADFDMLQGLDFKNPKDILKDETLETLEVVEKTKGDLEALKTKWQTQVEQQLSKESLAQIQQRIKELQTKSKNLKDLSAIQSVTAEIQALQKDIQSRIDTIQNFKKDLAADIRQAEKLASEIKALPKKDFDRWRKKYSLDLKGGTGLISKMVSGPLKTKIDKAWGYYKQISPYLKSDSDSKKESKPEKLERGKGQFIKFTSPKPFPDFLIRQAKLSLNVWDQDVAGDFQGLTDDPKVYGKPFNLNLTGSQNEAFKQFKLKLVLDRTRAEAADFLETQVDSLKIEPVPLGDWATLSQGFADINGKIDIQNEQNLKGNFKVKVHGASFVQTGKTANEMSRVLGNVLKSVNQFYIQGAVNGTPDEYTLNIKTDLDEILAKSVRKLFDEKIKTFEADLKKSVTASTAGPLSEVNSSVAGLVDFKKILKTEEGISKDLLNQATKKALLGKIPGGDSLKVPGGDSLLKKFKLPF
jgi:uncharacterized protein (TIGR03545 family)